MTLHGVIEAGGIIAQDLGVFFCKLYIISNFMFLLLREAGYLCYTLFLQGKKPHNTYTYIHIVKSFPS